MCTRPARLVSLLSLHPIDSQPYIRTRADKIECAHTGGLCFAWVLAGLYILTLLLQDYSDRFVVFPMQSIYTLPSIQPMSKPARSHHTVPHVSLLWSISKSGGAAAGATSLMYLDPATTTHYIALQTLYTPSALASRQIKQTCR